jgi:hypothetical protein
MLAKRIRMGDNRAQLNVGDDGAIVLMQHPNAVAVTPLAHSLLIRVSDADAHSTPTPSPTAHASCAHRATTLTSILPAAPRPSRNPSPTSTPATGAENLATSKFVIARKENLLSMFYRNIAFLLIAGAGILHAGQQDHRAQRPDLHQPLTHRLRPLQPRPLLAFADCLFPGRECAHAP